MLEAEANIINLQTSNELIWDAVLEAESNIINLQTSNELIWDAVFEAESNIIDLQTSNELIWDAVFEAESNIIDLQTSNELIWDVVFGAESNIVNLQTSNELIWSQFLDNVSRIETIEDNVILSNSYGIPSGFSRGDMIIASGDNFLSKLNVGTTGKVLMSSGQVPYWNEIELNTTTNNIYISDTDKWVQRGTDIIGVTNSQTGDSVSLSSDGTTMVVGQPGDEMVKIYTWSTSSNDWVLTKDITGFIYFQSGTSVSVSGDGNVVVFGSPPPGTYDGKVSVYENDGGTWTSTVIIPDRITDVGKFGWSVDLSIDGNRLIVGETTDYNENSYVYVYERGVGGTWSQLGQAITSTGDVELGYSVSISGDGSIISASAISDGNGKVYVYELVSGNWVQKGQTLEGSHVGESFGFSIDLSSDGDVLVVGSPFNNTNGYDSGQVKVYNWNTSSWVQKGFDINGFLISGSFGNNVAITDDGDTIIAGSLAVNGQTQTRVLKWTGTIWSEYGYKILDELLQGISCSSVTISFDGTVIAVGDSLEAPGGIVRAYVSTDVFASPEYDLTPITDRLDDLELSDVNINNAIGTNSNKIIVLENGFNTLDSRADGLNDRLTVAESTIGTLVTTTTNLSDRMTTAESTIGSLVTTTTSLSGRLTTAENTIVSLGTTTTGLLSDVSDNDTRITTLEQNPLTIAGAGLPSSFVPGDLFYASGVNSLSTIPIGTNGQVLKTNGTGYFWGDDITGGGDTGVGNLQAVTDEGAATNQTVYFQNTGDSVIASGTIRAVNFRGDGGLLSNLPTRPNLQEVTDEGVATTNKTITLTNTGDSLIASGKITAVSLSVDGQDITDGTITDNVQRIKNLETSNTLIWDLTRKTEANITNLQTSNELIWGVMFEAEANVINLQTSNELIWDVMFEAEANVINLQTSNELIWAVMFEAEANVINLQTSNELIWNEVDDLKSNTIIRTSGGITSLTQGDLLYAEDADTLSKLPIGAEGTILTTSTDGLPSWQAIPEVQGFNNYYESGGNTGISNTQPGTTLSVGSNLYVQDTGQDVLYVNGNVYIRQDLIVANRITADTIRCRRSFVNETVVVAERPPVIIRNIIPSG